MATESFLSEFPPVSTEHWERIIRENVKGAEYASKLIWHPEEGLAVRPYYRADDLAGLQFMAAAPGVFPYVRGSRPMGGWRIREEIDAVDPESANRNACKAIADGAEEIAFHRAKLESPSDVALLLASFHEIPLHFVGLGPASIQLLVERLRTQPHGANLSLDLDPLADLDFSAEILRTTPTAIKLFVIRGDQFQERAAGAIEEVGFTLSAAVDFMAAMQERGVGIDRIAGSLAFTFAMGPEFFVQIAKLRAFRLLWSKAVASFGGTREAARTGIHAHAAQWNQTIYDPHINILRATTEVISAMLGGADSISCAPFDECFKQPDESDRRLARNTQIVLKQEALLTRVADPIGGSYLIEVLTNSIASKAWKLFQELETAGGYQKARAAGVVTSVMERRSTSREQAVASRRRVLTGTNRFADASEKVLGSLDVLRIDATPRAAQSFEELRLRTEQFVNQTGRQPRIVLAEIGDAKMRSARSQFAADFLACAGLVTCKHSYESAEQIAKCEADLIVLCSSDAEYLAIAVQLMPILRKQKSLANVIVAGNPDTAEQLKNIGVADFIHIRSNAVEILTGIQQQLGIRN